MGRPAKLELVSKEGQWWGLWMVRRGGLGLAGMRVGSLASLDLAGKKDEMWGVKIWGIVPVL